MLPTKKSSAPIQKEGTDPKFCRLRRNTATIQRSGRFSQSDGERLKVDKGSKRRRLSWWLLCWRLQEAKKKKKK